MSFIGEEADPMWVAGTAAAFADVAELRDWITQPHPVFEPSPGEDVTVTGTLAVGSTRSLRATSSARSGRATRVARSRTTRTA